ncbi:DUF1853 family protein [Chitinimonas naiadis]
MSASSLADLHWLLTAPSLLEASALPSGVLHGDAAQGAAWWQLLDPAALTLPEPDASPAFRLGRYAEGLMQAAFAQLPGHRLLANQLAVREQGTSLGEYDFLLAQPDGLPALHIELAVKFYIALPTEQGLYYVGPGLRDALELKLARLYEHQLRLSHTPAGQAALPEPLAISPMAWLRGRMFYRNEQEQAWAALANDHQRGWWRCWGEELPRSQADSRWRSLHKAHWLAPDLAASEALGFKDWQHQAANHFLHSKWPLMVAEYAAPEAGGQELARGMVLAPDWPDPAMLQRLCGRLAALA